MKRFLGFVLRCLAAVGLAFLVAPGIARAQATCADRDLSRIGRQDTYVDTVEKRVTVDSATNQKITTYRLRISYKPGPTSSMRICLSKEPSTFTEPLRKPQPLPPVTTEAPPRPPATTVIPPQQNQSVQPPGRPGRSCWRTGLCELGLAALAGAGAWAVCHFSDVCDSGEIRQEVHQSGTYTNGNRKPIFKFSVPIP